MRATVYAIDPQKGFARDTDGFEYYFNPRHFTDASQYGQASVGTVIEFEPKSARKGMMAVSVRVIEMFETPQYNPTFVKSFTDERAFTPGFHWVYMDQMVVVRSMASRNKNDALNSLIAHVKHCGANCITGLVREEHTVREGNYFYTMHTWSGKAGIYRDVIQTEDEALAKQHRGEAKAVANNLQKPLEVLAQKLEKELQQQLHPSGVMHALSSILYVLARILVIVFSALGAIMRR